MDSRQIYFVNQIVEYIVHNGMMKDLSVLQEAPFTDKGSVVEIFTDMNIWMGIRKVIEQINANAGLSPLSQKPIGKYREDFFSYSDIYYDKEILVNMRGGEVTETLFPKHRTQMSQAPTFQPQLRVRLSYTVTATATGLIS